ncbi:putative rta1 domain-containing protein [Phaeoacremonium minimum UCRPA7]|uniref:Putative rta1 domain-containing protein n=1 Tax=Phaeoacremonium minimum (strain UCR-PA7) TaxID=1286976 RepID=R8BUP1_PHAM7|nr:putative rta1 domain-containing protein [Phaeoacremonium minimum UCRPA7]EOO03091.1 putative rta1 domain-containing protein [Phaeoacremonium minimum UCRPA7]
MLTRVIGGGRLADAKTKGDRNTGQTIILVGLFIQVAFFGLFIIVTCIFHYRIVQKPTARTYSLTVPWRGFLKALYAASVLIMIRSIFRVIEYIMGKDGELQSKEVYLYIFDALLMFSVAALFNALHPSRIISSHRKLVNPFSDSESQSDEYHMSRVDGDREVHTMGYVQ